ncbi:MAG: hypothetical protein V4650_15365 [Pseudomonadota bacterium]
MSTTQRMTLLAILLASAALKLGYVFGLTEYSKYVMSDSAHYYQRALALLQGQLPTHVDWDIYPMGASSLLALYWAALSVLGISSHTLETALLLNVLASTVCVALLWHLGWRLTGRPRLALLIAAAYSVFYPLVYLNAFTLSESPAQLFFMLSVWTFIEAYHRPHAARWLIASGLCWAVAAHCRGSFLPCAAASLLVLLWYPPPSLRRTGASCAFLLPGVAVFLLASAALWWASDGASYKPTGSNGGFNFFMQQCHFFGAKTYEPGWVWQFYPPVFRDQPELGIFETTVPFLNQGFYYREGLNCLQRLPGAWSRVLALGPEMIYGNFYPHFVTASGFEAGMRISRHISLALILLSPAGWWLLQRRHPAIALLLLAQSACLLLTFVFFSADHRHLYSLAFVYFLLGISGLAALLARGWPARLRYAALATATLAMAVFLFSGSGWLSLKHHRETSFPRHLIDTPLGDGTPWYALEAMRFWAPVNIELGGMRHHALLDLALDHNDVYTLSFWHGDEKLGAVQLSLARDPPPPQGLVARHVRIPPAIAARGYDRLRLEAISGDGRYSVGDLRLRD